MWSSDLSSTFEFLPNIQHIRHRLVLHYSDLTDGTNLRNLMLKIRPNEVYNLAAQSHVHVSFEIPEFTAETNAIGVLNILEAVRALVNDQRQNNEPETRFYQASTSELYGKVQEVPQNEKTPFYPRSPYGVAKLYAYWITVNYRESYGLHASNGILFNHESPRRGEQFVTRKITAGLARLFAGIQPFPIQLGNLDAKRDWGHAKDFVEGMWLMLQQDEPDDYVLATGVEYSIREFLDMSLNWFKCSWMYLGSKENEYVIDMNSKQTIVQVNPEFYRPAEVNSLLGDASKARSKLGWEPKYDIEALIRDMLEADTKRVGWEHPW